MLNDNKGITLVALTITIIILLIITSIGLVAGRDSIISSRSNRLIVEVEMVQHAVLERYSEYKLTKDSSLLVGTPISYSDASSVAEEMDYDLPNEGTYCELSHDDLVDLGLKDSNDTYIVNYELGIVLNATNKQTETGEYVYRDTN